MTFHCVLPCATQGAYWCPQSPHREDPTVWHQECLQISVVAQAETGLSGQVIQLVRCVSPRSCSGPGRGVDRARGEAEAPTATLVSAGAWYHVPTQGQAVGQRRTTLLSHHGPKLS